MKPKLTIERDYDNFFKKLVETWIERKYSENKPFKHREIVISSGPWRPNAITYESNGLQLHLDFYAAIRRSFGELTQQDITDIIELL